MRALLSQLSALISGASYTGEASILGVSTDSRNIAPGSLFVALRGERFDAHDFLPQAVRRGAAAVLVDTLPVGWALPAIVVPDTLVALGQMARHWRDQFAIPVIGVTGSNGKTTVKEMLATILACAYGEAARLATRGNLNNDIGVPLTLLRLDAQHRAAVVELGMNHPGEIGRLAAIAAPTIALVNNAQREHQEFMHTVDAVARENGSVFDALPPDGIAVFPGDDRFTPLWRAQGAGRRTITFGLDGACDVHCRYQASGFGSDLTVAANGTMSEISVAVAGVHNVRNALAAFGCALAVGVERRVIVRGLELFVPVSGRLQKKLGARGTTVIDDSYNANPDSVRAAIDVLAQAAAPRILVLGDMGEVGEQGREFHAEIGAYALERGIDTVLATGELARHLGAATQHFEQLEALQTALDARLANAPHATVLVKGSRFMKMERVVAHLLGPDHLQPEAH